MRYRRTLFPLLILALAFATLAGAQQTRSFTPEIALDVRNVRIAAVTDDGNLVAATVQTRRDRTDVDHQRYGDPTYISPVAMRLMVIDTRAGTRTWVHESPAQLRGFTWSPAGDRLAYFVVNDGAYELRVFDTATATSSTVALATDKEIASSSPLVFSPDGQAVVIGLRPVGWADEARRAFRALTDAAVIVQDSRNDFLAWDRVRNIANRQDTVLVALADGSVREVLDETPPQGVDFSADGSYLTYSTAMRTKTSYTRRDGTDYELWKLDLAGAAGAAATMAAESLMGPTDERLSVQWSEARDAFAYGEDGAVFVRRIGEDEAVDVTAAHRTPASDAARGDDAAGAGAEPRFSLARWSPAGDALLLTTEGGWHVLNLQADELREVLTLEEDEDARPRRAVQAWSDDGKYLFFSYSAPDRWHRGLKRIDVDTGEIQTLLLDASLYGSWNVSDDGDTIVYTMSDGDRPNEIWVTGHDYESPRRLTESNPELADVALARTELIEYLDVDGNRLYGILYYPSDYEEGRAYPLVAEIYEQFFDNGFNENMNLITAQGWFGFRPSVRFEEGYPGEAWLKAVPSAINKLIERGLVDEDKVGVYGQSYGGYAANLLITQTDRFAAAANVSGKVNIISFLGDSPKITTRNYAAAEVGQDRIGATLWEQPHKYIEHSAVMFADRIDTPLLMLSGEGDWNVPATNQREMYYALRRLGKEVVWVHYTAGGHGAGRASGEEDFVDHWSRMFAWFAEHFGETSRHRIVFQSEAGGGMDVWVMNADGSAAMNLTNNGARGFNDRHPTASADGATIAFRSDRDGNPDVFAMTTDGSHQRNLSSHPAADIDPAFSPDGSKIAFDSDRDGDVEIWVMSADGSDPRQLTINDAVDSHPYWSPDGSRIAFYSNRDNPGSEAMDIYVMDAEGGDVRRLTDHPADDRYPSFSPDGQRITFSSDRDGNPEIYVMDADGGNVVRVTDDPGGDLAPVWSPDGNWIVFRAERHGAGEIYVIRPDGTGERRLTNNDVEDSNPRWLPVPRGR